MDQMQNTVARDTARNTVRRMFRFTVLVAVIGFGLKSLVLSPVYIRFATNIAYADAWWVNLLYLLTDGGIIDLSVFALCYPATLYAVWRAGLKKAARVPISFTLITLGKFMLNFFMTCITDSGLPDIDEFLYFDLPVILVMYLLEILQYAIMILILCLAKRRYKARMTADEAQALLTGGAPVREGVFPFRKLVSVKNPVQFSAFMTSVVVLVGRVAMHQIYQYTLYLDGGTEGIFVMLLDLVCDLFISVILYFAALLLLSRFDRKELEENIA